jgi:hypothetical protein
MAKSKEVLEEESREFGRLYHQSAALFKAKTGDKVVCLSRDELIEMRVLFNMIEKATSEVPTPGFVKLFGSKKELKALASKYNMVIERISKTMITNGNVGSICVTFEEFPPSYNVGIVDDLEKGIHPEWHRKKT